MSELAPVIIFAYRRPAHLARTLSALASNIEASQTHLIVYCDHVPEGANESAIYQMHLTRSIAHRENRFLSVDVIERTSNHGLAENILQGVTEVIRKFGKAIVLEDDLLVAPGFLKYMNEALIRYENENEVACISAYVYPLQETPSSSFFIRGADCWGWATWASKWSLIERDANRLIQEIERKNLVSVFDFDGSYPYMKMLLDKSQGRNNSWAILWYASALINNKLCLYPAQSLVQNIGNDGSGTNHQSWTNSYRISFQTATEFSWPATIGESQRGRELFIRFFKGVKQSFALRLRRKLGRILRSFNKDKGNNLWTGDYQSWQEAQSDCTGYDSNNILNQVASAISKVVKGEAAYERDGVAFKDFEYSENVLSTLLHAFNQKGQPIIVADFGGSLGSLYFQYRTLLKDKIESWNVVEQKHFVDRGKAEFENDILQFYHSLEELCAIKTPDLLILSSVICYLEDPFFWVEKFKALGIQYVLLDRTAFIQGKSDRLTIQHVPESIYPASYPAWFLNEEKLLMSWISDYDIVSELPDTIDGENLIDGVVCYRKGYYFKRKE
jgi:putative methyltransferase (TIGR04325 family)